MRRTHLLRRQPEYKYVWWEHDINAPVLQTPR